MGFCAVVGRTEADGGDGRHDLAKLELVEDGGLAGGVEADHEDAHFLLAEELAEQLGDRAAGTKRRGRRRERAREWRCKRA